MRQAARSAGSAAPFEWDAQLMDAFVDDLMGWSAGLFASCLREILRSVVAAGNEVGAWHAVLTTMRRLLVPVLLGDPPRWLDAEDLWQGARVLVGEIAESAQARQRLHVDRWARTLSQTSEALLSTVDTTGEYFPGNSTYGAGSYGLGQRVPMLVVSPWSKGGYVCSETFDHTSIIRFIEQRFKRTHNVRSPNISKWRRAVCGDLTSAFNFATPNEVVPALPSTAAYVPKDKLRHASYVPLPPLVQAVPKQEAGVRASRALPYELFDPTA
jgi:hypothetical protein